MGTYKVSQRKLLQSLGIAGGSVVLVACATPPSKVSERQARPQIRLWYQAENHKSEYEGRKTEFEEKFGIELIYELLGPDAMTKKLGAQNLAFSRALCCL